MDFGIIRYAHAQVEDLGLGIVSKGNELIEVMNDLVTAMGKMDWEAEDRTAFDEFQTKWTNRDFDLHTVLQGLGKQVGIANTNTIATAHSNAGMLQSLM